MARLIKPSILNENFPTNRAIRAVYRYLSSSPSAVVGWSSSVESSLEANQSVVELELRNQTPSSLLLHKQSPQAVYWHMDGDAAQMEHSIDLNLNLKLLLYCMYVLIFLVGITGNALVCYVVYTGSAMRTVTNLFIANLALSDILLCLFCVPFTPLYLLTFKEWIFGWTFCHLVAFAQGVSVCISVFTLMWIAIERYSVIVHPFRRPINIQRCAIIIVGVWAFGIVCTLPYGIFIDVVTWVNLSPEHFFKSNASQSAGQSESNSSQVASLQPLNRQQYSQDRLEDYLRWLKPKHYCHEMWPNEWMRLSYGLISMVVQFVVPFIVITFCYTKVCSRLWHRIRSRPGSSNCSSQRKWLEKERARRTNLMLISMVIIFVVSWLPLNIYNLIEDFHSSVAYWKHSKTMFVVFHLIAMSSTCYNPFLYAWLNDNFRKEFKKSTLDQSKETRNRALTVLGQSARTDNNSIYKDTKNCTKTTDLKGMTAEREDEAEGDCASVTMLETTTNLVTNLESINEIELQESLLVTSIRNGVYANRVLASTPTSMQASTNKL